MRDQHKDSPGNTIPSSLSLSKQMSPNFHKLGASWASSISTLTTIGKGRVLPIRPWPAAVFMTSELLQPDIHKTLPVYCRQPNSVPMQSGVPPTKPILFHFCHKHKILSISKRNQLQTRSLSISIKLLSTS